MELSRRGFIKLTGAGLAASSLSALGFGFAGDALAASVRPFKLAATIGTRTTGVGHQDAATQFRAARSRPTIPRRMYAYL